MRGSGFLNLKDLLKSGKQRDVLICVFAALAVIALYAAVSRQQPAEESYVQDNSAINLSQEEKLEQRLAGVLELVEGAGRVEVFLLFDGSYELVPAYNYQNSAQNSTTSGQGSSTSSISENQTRSVSASGSDTLIVKELMPQIKGAIVVAQGAGDISVKLRLIDAVQTALGIEAEKVEIFQMNE